jgi:hypothetical protein
MAGFRIHHRLMAGGRKIQDRETPMAEDEGSAL